MSMLGSILSRRRFQFSTRALIFCCVIVSVPMAWIAGVKYDAAKFRRTAEIVRTDFVAIQNEPALSTNFFKNAVQTTIDRDAYQQINYLGWTGNRHLTSELAMQVQAVPGLQDIQFSRYSVAYSPGSGGMVKWTDQELLQISQIKSLTSVNLDGTYSDAAVAPLLRLPLHQLVLPDTPLSEELASLLSRSESLNSVGFDLQDSTQAVWRALGRIRNLSQLSLHRIAPGKSHFQELEACQILRGLQLVDSQISEEEGLNIARLKLKQVHLVDCHIAPGFFSALKTDHNVPEVVISQHGNVQIYDATYAALSELEKRHTTNSNLNQSNANPLPETRPE